MTLQPSIFSGQVSHSRLQPNQHSFSYPLSMILLDIDRLSETFEQSKWWSLERFNLISFYRRDYLGRHRGDLKTAVKERIFKHDGERFDGKVFLLTHPRYLGFVFNPVSFYFCYDHDGQLAYLLADINNTPWNERHCYVMKADTTASVHQQFDKQFHISPFMPMDIRYDWSFELDDGSLKVQMDLYRNQAKHFHAAMMLQAEPLTAASMSRLPWQYPLQTWRVLSRIYWQAFRLWLKKTPFYGHPDTDMEPDSLNKNKHCEDSR